MTDFPLNPGCFGSVLFFNANAEECLSCAAAVTCQATVRNRVRSVVPHLTKLDQDLREKRSLELLKWISARMVRKVTQDRSTVRKTALLDRLSAAGVNVYHLRHRTNPCEVPGTLLHNLFGFMLDAGPFKPRDVVEHLQPLHPSESKAKLTSQVKELCEALLHVSVLKKEKHVLCLNPN